ncbi:MAG: hypothetical protein HYY18_10465 [Planctomycetes bacterium]|nr:hypothetical protein [Planctomycetota bacterium]
MCRARDAAVGRVVARRMMIAGEHASGDTPVRFQREARAAAMAEDLGRFLDVEPAASRRRELAYRGAKIVRRHPAAGESDFADQAKDSGFYVAFLAADPHRV